MIHSPKQQSFSFSWRWVRRHVSHRKQPHEFTFAETLNETADNLATLARHGRALDHDYDHWPAEQVVSVIGPRGRVCVGMLHASFDIVALQVTPSSIGRIATSGMLP
jgi:hypothetical protein